VHLHDLNVADNLFDSFLTLEKDLRSGSSSLQNSSIKNEKEENSN